MSDQGHIAVLSNEVFENLINTGCGTFVDATVGATGHALGILDRNRNLNLIGIDEIRKHWTRRGRCWKSMPTCNATEGKFQELEGIAIWIGVSSIEWYTI